MQRFMVLCAAVAMTAGLSACASSDNYAPVVNVSDFEAIPPSGTYTATDKDTLYAIAWRYGLDDQTLAERNHLIPPYKLHAGQLIYLTDVKVPVAAPAPEVASAPAQVTAAAETATAPVVSDQQEPAFIAKGWRWPAHGKLLAVFSRRNKGIDIGSTLGAPVYAALAGKVVYAGNGLRGYGNLIILKHNNKYLSAYAYNKQIFVKEGRWVKSGQKIAAMGRGPNGRFELHFEIRKAGVPVNPLNLL